MSSWKPIIGLGIVVGGVVVLGLVQRFSTPPPLLINKADHILAADLLAQNSMAWAAWWMVALTALGLSVAAASLVFLWLAARYTRDAALAARSTLDATKKTARRQLRAYVGLDYVAPMVRLSPDGADGAVFQAVIKNSGQTPAHVRALHTRLAVTEAVPDVTPTAEFVRDDRFEYGLLLPSSGARMQPVVLEGELYDFVFTGQRRAFLLGHIEYDDIFPNTPLRSQQFCIELLVGVPRNQLPTNGPIPEGTLTTINYARYDISESTRKAPFWRTGPSASVDAGGVSR